MQNQKQVSKLKVIPLGGVEEIGINSTVFEYENQLVVVDLGLGFPDNNMYGVDYLVPNIDYLTKKLDQIEGIIITHGHLDHIGALPYLLPKLNFPELIGTEFTLELIKAKLDDFGLLNKAKFRVITPNSVLQSGNFRLSFFRVNHSIPQCIGVVVETPAGCVVHTGDFKFDNSPVNEPVADYARMAQLGEQGVDLLLSDSTNSLRKGYPISESDVAYGLQDAIERANGRVIIASFSGLVGRLYQIIKIAEQLGRKVAIAGYGMNQTLRIAQEIDYIKPKQGTIIPLQKINRYSDNKIILLTTGSQGESNAALARMASTEGYKNIHLKKTDTVVISAGTIPGNNMAVQLLIDQITSQGAKVHQSENMDFFTSGHGYQEDQKIMLNLIKPKYFMPVHGYQYFLRAHANTAQQVGIKESNIIIAERGSIVEGNKQSGFSVNGKVKNTPLLVSGSGVGDIGASILAERQQLGNNGVIVISAVLDQKTQSLLQDPVVYTKGFIYVKSNRDLIEEIKNIAKTELSKLGKRHSNATTAREQLDRNITKYVEKEIERTPLVITMLNFISSNGDGPTAPKPHKPNVKKQNPPTHNKHPRPPRPETAPAAATETTSP
jgi:ribonuclease J